MRHLAITGIETAAMISRIFLGDAMRATPPSARIWAGTRSSAITATAPAFSAITACSALVTSMMTPPFNISASPVFRRRLVEFPLFCDIDPLFFCCYQSILRVDSLKCPLSYTCYIPLFECSGSFASFLYCAEQKINGKGWLRFGEGRKEDQNQHGQETQHAAFES